MDGELTGGYDVQAISDSMRAVVGDGKVDCEETASAAAGWEVAEGDETNVGAGWTAGGAANANRLESCAARIEDSTRSTEVSARVCGERGRHGWWVLLVEELGAELFRMDPDTAA